MLAEKLDVQPGDLKRFWPDREALLYDCLRYHGQQIDTGAASCCWMRT